jgi:hypothetical protein
MRDWRRQEEDLYAPAANQSNPRKKPPGGNFEETNVDIQLPMPPLTDAQSPREFLSQGIAHAAGQEDCERVVISRAGDLDADFHMRGDVGSSLLRGRVVGGGTGGILYFGFNAHYALTTVGPDHARGAVGRGEDVEFGGKRAKLGRFSSVRADRGYIGKGGMEVGQFCWGEEGGGCGRYWCHGWGGGGQD